MKLTKPQLEDTLLIGLLVFAPFAFASVHTWAYSIIALVSVILFNIHFLMPGQRKLSGVRHQLSVKERSVVRGPSTVESKSSVVRRPSTEVSVNRGSAPHASLRLSAEALAKAEAKGDEAISKSSSPSPLALCLKRPTSIAILLFLFINILYIIPLPSVVISSLSPKAYSLREAYAFDAPSWQTLSVYPRATVSYLIKLVSFILIYFVVFSKIRYCRPAKLRKQRQASSVKRQGDRTDASNPSPLASSLTFRGTHRPRSIHPAFIMFGAIAGVLSILFHSFSDFNLHMPANALYFTILCAIIGAVSSSKRPEARGQRPENPQNCHCEERSDAAISKSSSLSPIAPSLNYSFLNKLVTSIIIIGFVVGLFGIIQWFSWNGKMFWFIKKSGKSFGPYVNYNHFAGFMEMTGFFAIALFYSGIFLSPLRHIKKLKDKIIWFSSAQANKTLLYLFGGAVIVGALFLSSSRGGIISFALAFIIFSVVCIMIGPRVRKNKIRVSVGIVLGLFVLMIMWLGPENTIGRFKTLISALQTMYKGEHNELLLRPYIWVDTVKMIKSFPLAGTGLGAYSDIFMPFRTFPTKWGFLRYAHQDYLHLLSEMGAVGAGFLVAFLVWYFKRFRECVRRLKAGAEHLEN